MTALSAREQTLAHALIDDQLDALGVVAWITGWVMGSLDELAQRLRALLTDRVLVRRNLLIVHALAVDGADARVQALLLTALLDWRRGASRDGAQTAAVLPAAVGLRGADGDEPTTCWPRSSPVAPAARCAARPQHLRRTLAREGAAVTLKA